MKAKCGQMVLVNIWITPKLLLTFHNDLLRGAREREREYSGEDKLRCAFFLSSCRDPVSVLLQQQKGEGVQTVRSSDTKSNLLLVARHLWTCTVDCGRLRAGCALSSQTMSMNT